MRLDNKGNSNRIIDRTGSAYKPTTMERFLGAVKATVTGNEKFRVPNEEEFQRQFDQAVRARSQGPNQGWTGGPIEGITRKPVPITEDMIREGARQNAELARRNEATMKKIRDHYANQSFLDKALELVVGPSRIK